MTDPRLERLRELDAAATPGPWVLWDKSNAGYLLLGFTGDEPAEHIYSEPDAEWIATARRMLPATIELLELLAEHTNITDALEDHVCSYCDELWPCRYAKARDAVLDQIGGDDA